MKRLIDYFFESENLQNLKDKIKKQVDDSSNVQLLNKAYRILQTIPQKKFDKLQIEVFKGNNNGFKEFIHLLEKIDNKINILTALCDKNDKDYFPSLDTLLKGSKEKKTLFDILLNDDFIKLFDTKEKALSFLKELIKISYKDQNNKGVGRGELYLFSLFKNTSNHSKGDVNMDNIDIEVKMSTSYSANGGKLKAAKLNLRSPKDIVNFLKDKYKIEENISLGGFNIMNQTINKISNDTEDAFYKLLDGILYQFENLYNEKNFDILKSFVQTIGIDTKNAGQQIIRLHGCLALIEYHNADGWKYLLVGNASDGNYYMIDGKTCDLDHLKDLYNNERFMFKDGPMTSEGANERNYVSSIYVSPIK